MIEKNCFIIYVWKDNYFLKPVKDLVLWIKIESKKKRQKMTWGAGFWNIKVTKISEREKRLKVWNNQKNDEKKNQSRRLFWGYRCIINCFY